jgi:hypothetical protein
MFLPLPPSLLGSLCPAVRYHWHTWVEVGGEVLDLKNALKLLQVRGGGWKEGGGGVRAG